MSFFNVAVMVGIVFGIMVASMLYYGSRGKKQMRIGFDALAGILDGTVQQKNRMHYPHLSGTLKGRSVEVFFHLSEGHRRTSDFVYLVLATPAHLAGTTLVVSEGYFATTPGKGNFNEVAGDYLADLMPGRYVYAPDEAHTRALFADGRLVETLAPLARYANIVLGPDAITVGKPYGGPRDLTEQGLLDDLARLTALAGLLESLAPAHGKHKKGRGAASKGRGG